MGEIGTISRSVIDGEILFVAAVNDDKRSYSMTVGEDGKLRALTEDLTLSDAPEAVRKTVLEKLGTSKLESLTKAT